MSDLLHDHLALIRCLAEGRFVSGPSLASHLGRSRSTISRDIRTLQKRYGLKVDSVRGRGYRISPAIEWLMADRIANSSGWGRNQIDVLLTTTSTNSVLLTQTLPEDGTPKALLAEFQTAGKGRRGRTWQAPIGRHLCLSLGWRFAGQLHALPGLSLAAAVTLCKTLEKFGCEGIRIKWPNDLLFDDAKLSGILLETSGEIFEERNLVLGIGLNIGGQCDYDAPIEQSHTSLSEMGMRTISRNELAGHILHDLGAMYCIYRREGLSPFIGDWNLRDRCYGEQVDLHFGDRIVTGEARGIDRSGALMLLGRQGLKAYAAGEVSLRMHDAVTA